MHSLAAGGRAATEGRQAELRIQAASERLVRPRGLGPAAPWICIRLWAMALPSTRAGRTLLAARAALGVSTLLAPRLAGRAFFLDPQDNPQLPVIGRMWGIRNLAL